MAFNPLKILGLLGGGIGANALGRQFQKSPKLKQFDLQTPNQKARSEFAGQRGQELINNPYQGFEPLANQAVSRFQNQTVPGLAERFTSMGNNATSSPAFASQLGQAGAGLSGELAALQSQYGLQNQQFGHDLLQTGQRPQFENVMMPGRDTFLSSLFSDAGQGLGALGSQGLNQYMNTPRQPKQSATGTAASSDRAPGDPLIAKALQAGQNYRNTGQQSYQQRLYGNQEMEPLAPNQMPMNNQQQSWNYGPQAYGPQGNYSSQQLSPNDSNGSFLGDIFSGANRGWEQVGQGQPADYSYFPNAFSGAFSRANQGWEEVGGGPRPSINSGPGAISNAFNRANKGWEQVGRGQQPDNYIAQAFGRANKGWEQVGRGGR